VNGFTIAGHVAVDRVITLYDEYVQLGGPPCFASALGKSLEFQVDVVTRIGEDFPDTLVPVIRSLGIPDEKRSKYPTTRFVLDYRCEPREMRVPKTCEPIEASEVENADRLLICPIVDEISDELLLDVDPDFLALDPQGLVRQINEDHTVSQKHWSNPKVLRKIDLLKTSSSELHLITGTSDIQRSLQKLIDLGVGVAVVTDGSNGSYVMAGKSFFRVPVYPVEVLDSTGAGDVFMAGLASHLDEGLMWACSIASASSSAVIETHGAEIKCRKEEILQRAQIIHENIKRLG
jgi:hypothetical protein